MLVTLDTELMNSDTLMGVANALCEAQYPLDKTVMPNLFNEGFDKMKTEREERWRKDAT